MKNLKHVVGEYLAEQKIVKMLVNEMICSNYSEASKLIHNLKVDEEDLRMYLESKGLTYPDISEAEMRPLVSAFPEIQRRMELENAKELIEQAYKPHN